VRPSKPGPLFSITFALWFFIFEKLLFSFSSANGLVVHLKKGSFPGFWPCSEHYGTLMRTALAASEQIGGVL
jgi:hypothetical protein